MTAAPLDPAAIMANHHEHHDADGVWCATCYGPGRDGKPITWPCETYRLADGLAAAQQPRCPVCGHEDQAHGDAVGCNFYSVDDEYECDCWRIQREINALRAALAGEGVVVTVNTDPPKPPYGTPERAEYDRRAAVDHHWTPGRFGGGCRVMLARYPCPYAEDEHPVGPPENVTVHGYRMNISGPPAGQDRFA